MARPRKIQQLAAPVTHASAPDDGLVTVTITHDATVFLDDGGTAEKDDKPTVSPELAEALIAKGLAKK